MSVQNRVQALPLTSFDSADITISYQPINSAGFAQAPFLIRLVNDSDEDVGISYDGVTDHEYIPANTSLVLNFQTNAMPNSNFAVMARNTIVYVRGATAGTGRIYLTAYYIPFN